MAKSRQITLSLAWALVVTTAVLLTLGVVIWQLIQQQSRADFERRVIMYLHCKTLYVIGHADDLCVDFDFSKRGEALVKKKLDVVKERAGQK